MARTQNTAVALEDTALDTATGGRYGNAWMPMPSSAAMAETNVVTVGGVPNTADGIVVQDDLSTGFEINF